VKDVAQAIRDNKPINMHPDMYNNAVIDMLGEYNAVMDHYKKCVN
jgi:hypothetical protein